MTTKPRLTTYTFAGNDKLTGNIRQIKIKSASMAAAETAAKAKLVNPRVMLV